MLPRALRLYPNLRLYSTTSMLNSVEKQRRFLSFPMFAVVGASTDKSKWGTKILLWYIQRNRPVTPVHPNVDELEGIKTVKSIVDLPSPTETALSITTPPKVTLSLLKQAKELSIPAIWIQPGASDTACADFINENGMADQVLWQGECLWRDGDGVIQAML
ncbi:CoA binding domain-containing protein [Pisolithus croceorrhizus]|nr:CoA binding domain-containing protein [Pisolithus croceorrhizus]